MLWDMDFSSYFKICWCFPSFILTLVATSSFTNRLTFRWWNFCFLRSRFSRLSSLASNFLLVSLILGLNAVVLNWINSVWSKRTWFRTHDRRKRWRNSFCIIELYLFVSRINSRTRFVRFLTEVSLIFAANSARLAARSSRIWICWEIFIRRGSDWVSV